jgi:serine/threonine protein kinase
VLKDRSLLGKGGFCSVYRMCSPSSATPFAVKVLNIEDLGLDEAQTAEIEREATLLQGLKHKHVIQYKGHSFHDEVEFRLVLEYASGGTLADHILEEMSSDLQLRLMRELACGLLYIHGQNVLHRDLKSSNILLAGSELRVKISDFGLSAQLCFTAASKRSIGGTAQYFSPERGQEQSYGFAADMWATGCIVLECLLKEHLKEALWQEHKEAALRHKIDAATVKNPLLGTQASKLLQREAEKRISASQLFSALSAKQVPIKSF